MRFYGNLTKVDEEQRMVWGYASTEAVDLQGETVLKSAIENALEDYMKFANIREMHQLSAVGTAEEASVDDKGLYLGAKVIDDTAWGKVTGGVYKGFSVGGKVLARDPKNKKIITKILMTEISLVDRPSNPEARFDVWKAAGSPQEDDMAKKPLKTASTAIGAELPLGPLALPATMSTVDLVKAVDSAVAAGRVITVPNQESGEALRKINDQVTFVIGEDGSSVTFKPDGEVIVKSAAATVETPSTAPVVAEGSTEITHGAQDMTVGATAEGETVAKADGEVVIAPAGDTAADVDPIAKATAALNAADEKVAAIATADTTKSMYSVSRFADIMSALSNLAIDTQFEAEYEGDGSPVPAKLKDWLKAGAVIFKDMAKEEVDELVAAGKIKKAAGGDSITVDLSVTGGEALAKSITDITTERDTIAKTLIERDEQLVKLADHVTTTIGRMDETIDTLTKRLAVVEAQPLEPKTAGAMAVSKEDDAGGAGTLAKAAEFSQEDITKALGEMSEDDRAMLLIKAAQQLPRRVDFRTVTPGT